MAFTNRSHYIPKYNFSESDSQESPTFEIQHRKINSLERSINYKNKNNNENKYKKKIFNQNYLDNSKFSKKYLKKKSEQNSFDLKKKVSENTTNLMSSRKNDAISEKEILSSYIDQFIINVPKPIENNVIQQNSLNHQRKFLKQGKFNAKKYVTDSNAKKLIDSIFDKKL